MKRLAFVLTAFLIQSCYTVFYTTNEYADFVGVSPNPPATEPVIIDRPHEPCSPSPGIVSEPAYVAPAQSNPPEASRPRTEGATRPPAVNTPTNQPVERVRASSPQPAAQNAGQQSGGPQRERASSEQQNQQPRQRPQ